MTAEGIKRFRNDFECESLFVPCGIALGEIPSPYRELIDKRYQRFLENPAKCLETLAKKASFAAEGMDGSTKPERSIWAHCPPRRCSMGPYSTN